MKRILIADDNEAFRVMFATVLEGARYEVAQAANGREALGLFLELRPDLVLCDIVMPELEGIETMGEMLRIVPGVRIIAMSGGGRVHARDHLKLARAMGASATLAKPFSGDEALCVIEKVLRQSSPQRPARSDIPVGAALWDRH